MSLEVKPLLDENHSLEMTVPEQTERLYLDSELFCNLVRILVSNAVKYSPEGGPVKVEFMTTTGQLKVAVQDHGIGVPDADKNRLLDPFFRAGNIGTIRGTGSGLSIVKEIVDLHSGSINIESQLDHGTTFTITVPTSRN